MLTLLAGVCLGLPIWYAFTIWRELGPFGTLIVWTTVSVAAFGIVTVVVSVVRAFVAPALRSELMGRDGNV